MNETHAILFFNPVGDLVSQDSPTQDRNGNRIRDSKLKLFFDLFDRLVRVEDAVTGQTVGRYRYDAAGRRVHREFKEPVSGTTREVFYVCDGAQVIEELDGLGQVLAEYVYGHYVDQAVQMLRDRGLSAGGASSGLEEFYLHGDSLYSTAALTDAAGAVVERYGYSSIYGVAQVQDPVGNARAPPAEIGNPYRFQGRRFDPESGLYYFRQRYLDPEQGRFVSRDPLGLWGDPGNVGNAYTFAGNDPVNGVDPFGDYVPITGDLNRDRIDPFGTRRTNNVHVEVTYESAGDAIEGIEDAGKDIGKALATGVTQGAKDLAWCFESDGTLGVVNYLLATAEEGIVGFPDACTEVGIQFEKADLSSRAGARAFVLATVGALGIFQALGGFKALGGKLLGRGAKPGTIRVRQRVCNRDYDFDVDDLGRTTRASGPLANPNSLTYEHRSPSAQRSVAGGHQGDPSAGHLLGNQFGAPGGKTNLVPMSRQLNLSGWKIMENDLKKLTRCSRVNVTVSVHYKGKNKMPSRFTVDAEITNPRTGWTTTRRWTHTQTPQF